jgi:hypothetical protein
MIWALLTTKLNDANIFFREKRKCSKLFWLWKFEKTIQYENWFLNTEKLLDLIQIQGNPYVGQDQKILKINYINSEN